MAIVHMTEAELARDVQAVLAKLREGDEVIVEQDHRAVAVIKAPRPGPDRLLSECIALAKAHEEALGYAPTLDDDFARDLEEIIASRREPLESRWD
jgi:hypothetical protein